MTEQNNETTPAETTAEQTGSIETPAEQVETQYESGAYQADGALAPSITYEAGENEEEEEAVCDPEDLSRASDLAVAMEFQRRMGAQQALAERKKRESGPFAEPEKVRQMVFSMGDPATQRYERGNLAKWRPNMKVASWPAYDEAVVVVQHLPAKLEMPHEIQGGEPFDLEVAALARREDGEEVLVTFMLPSRRMMPA